METLLRAGFRLLDDGLQLVSKFRSQRSRSALTRSRGLVMSYGVFFELYDDHLLPSASDLGLGLIGGTQSCLALLLSIVVGRLLDVQKHRWISITGLVFIILALFLLSAVGRHYGLIWLTSGLLAGVGMSCFFMHSSHNAIQVNFLANYLFPRQRS